MTPDREIVKALTDSNLVVSAMISPGGAPYAVMRAFREHRFSLFIADEELDELKRLADDHCPGVYCVSNAIELETHLAA